MSIQKYCSKCHKTSEFYVRKTGKSSTYCKECEKRIRRDNYVKKMPKRLDAHGNLRCSNCKQHKTPDEFYVSKRNKHGRTYWCKDCYSHYATESYVSQATKVNKYRNKENNQFKKDRVLMRRFYSYANQCKRRKKNIEFHLTLEQFYEMTSSLCHYCGQKSRNKNYVGIDRVDSNGHYTNDNCVPCCDVCNIMKKEYSFDFFVTHLIKIFNHMSGM